MGYAYKIWNKLCEFMEGVDLLHSNRCLVETSLDFMVLICRLIIATLTENAHS